jgi:hypothetical protein
MRQNNRADPREAKELARKKYAERQIDRWVKWTIENKGFMLYKDLIQKQEEFNIVCYG